MKTVAKTAEERQRIRNCAPLLGEPAAEVVTTLLDELEAALVPRGWANHPDEWSDAISAAHPTVSGSHAEYAVALQMVGNRYSKHALVELVSWLLVRVGKTESVLDAAQAERAKFVAAVFLKETDPAALVGATTLEVLGGITNYQDAYDSMEREVEKMRPVVDAALDLTGPDTSADEWNALGKAIVAYTGECPHGGLPELCEGEDCDGVRGKRCSTGGAECDKRATRRMVGADDMYGCDDHGPKVFPNDEWEELPNAAAVRALEAKS